jgi:AraC family transcriptional regulator
MIAFGAGYETHEAFTRAFRACYDDSPTGFRERKHPFSGPVIELAARSGVHFSPTGAPSTFIPIDTGGRSMHVEITTYPALRVATVHHVGPYNRIAEAFSRLGEIAGPAGLYADPAAAMVALYHDDPDSTPAAQLQSDAGLVVSDRTALPPSLGETHIPAGRYARTVHRGPYSELGDVWARFMGEWLPASGHRLGDGASYELYLNNPHGIPSSDYLTELRIPLAD